MVVCAGGSMVLEFASNIAERRFDDPALGASAEFADFRREAFGRGAASWWRLRSGWRWCRFEHGGQAPDGHGCSDDDEARRLTLCEIGFRGLSAKVWRRFRALYEVTITCPAVLPADLSPLTVSSQVQVLAHQPTEPARQKTSQRCASSAAKRRTTEQQPSGGHHSRRRHRGGGHARAGHRNRRGGPSHDPGGHHSHRGGPCHRHGHGHDHSSRRHDRTSVAATAAVAVVVATAAATAAAPAVIVAATPPTRRGRPRRSRRCPTPPRPGGATSRGCPSRSRSPRAARARW